MLARLANFASANMFEILILLTLISGISVYKNNWSGAAFGKVGIDMLAGPSEVLVLADEFAKPDIVAADLIAQAEHDTAASSVLISTSLELI